MIQMASENHLYMLYFSRWSFMIGVHKHTYTIKRPFIADM